MGPSLLMAIALMLIIEGIMPFVAPSSWREILKRISVFTDGQIRFFGLTSMATGLVLLIIVQ